MKLFKPATSTSGIWNLSKTLLQTAVFWLTFLYLLPMGIVRLQSMLDWGGFAPQPEVGWTCFVMFSMLGLYSGYTMSKQGKGTPLPTDCPNELVIAGPYRFVRNPMAVAGIGQGISVGIILGSFLVILYAGIGGVLWHVLVRPVEEKDLAARFGEAYEAYRRKTRCWLPKLWL
ncbi:MAG: isoprenylcysteine carboxylmethyltransferase family protein [Bacteroidota bacterium]